MLRLRKIRICLAIILLQGLCIFFTPMVFAAGASQSNPPSLQGLTPDQVDSLMAKLSDEQVRNLLIAELQKESSNRIAEEKKVGGIYGVFSHWLQIMHTQAGDMDSRIDHLILKIGQVPGDLREVAVKIGGEREIKGFWLTLLFIAGILLFSFGAELLFRALTRKTRGEFLEKEIPQLRGMLRFWAADLRILPEFIDIIVFAVAAFLIFVFIQEFERPEMRMLFLAVLVPVIAIRIFSVLAQLVYAPN
ncbi:MAG: hypothetical protein ACWGN1_07235, partial [Desulfobulbales bacterium]